jgi:3-oxoacyl-[acyl-carrier protein] reductase
MVDSDISGRVVIVTGASRGIGRGIALHLARQGVRLAITGRRPDRLEAIST